MEVYLWLWLCAVLGPLGTAAHKAKTKEEREKEARGKLDSVDAFFVKGVASPEDLQAADEDEMTERVDKSIEFLEKMAVDRSSLNEIATQEVKQILAQVDGWLIRVRSFKEDLADRSKDFEGTRREWNDFIASAWNGGLSQLVHFVQVATSAVSRPGAAASLAAVLPALLVRLLT